MLKDELRFIPKIPTCDQLEEKQMNNSKKLKQLTTKQTGESRMVTKVIYKSFLRIYFLIC